MVNVTTFTVANAALMLLCFQCKTKEAILHAIGLALISTSGELVVMGAMGLFLNDFEAFRESQSALFAFGAASKCLYFFFAELILIALRARKNRHQDTSSTALLLSLSPLTSTLVMLALIGIGFYVKLPSWAHTTIIAMTLLLLFTNILVFVAYDHYHKLNSQYLDVQLDLSRQKSNEEYYHIMESQYEEQRVLIHDIRGHLGTMRHLAEEQRHDEVMQYIDEAENSPALKRKSRYCSNAALNVILYHYVIECENTGIILNLDIRNDTLSFMEPMDTTALFHNLLQNALEAAKESTGRTIDLTICQIPPSNNLLIRIDNDCDQEPIKLESGLFQTKKSDCKIHGVGLKSIRRVIEKYGGEQKVEYHPEAKKFSHQILFFQEKLYH